jgi:hypothetical protein
VQNDLLYLILLQLNLQNRSNIELRELVNVDSELVGEDANVQASVAESNGRISAGHDNEDDFAVLGSLHDSFTHHIVLAVLDEHFSEVFHVLSEDGLAGAILKVVTNAEQFDYQSFHAGQHFNGVVDAAHRLDLSEILREVFSFVVLPLLLVGERALQFGLHIYIVLCCLLY